MSLARLQQATTATLVLVAAGWAVQAWHAGRPLAALVGAVAIIGGYALVLALEFALMASVHGADPVPRATLAQLARAWWDEVRATPRVFGWRQPFRSRLWPDHLPPDAAGRRGVLLIHGFVCNRGIWNDWLRRLHAAGVPFVALDLEPVFGSIDDCIASVEEAVRRIERATGRAPVVVAHSMGGLVLRRWWAEHGDDARIHHAITIASPHHGTWLARFAFSRNARQLRQRCGWLQALAEREPFGRYRRFTCFHGHCDNIVFPASSATLEGADNRHLPGVAHVAMVDRDEPWQELLHRLAT